MSAPIAGTVLTTFSGLPSFEQQIAYMISHGVSLQNTYNAANPSTAQARFAISPNYATNTVTGQISLALQPNTVESTLYAGVIAFLP